LLPEGLRRDTLRGMMTGVCAGIARYTGISLRLVRLATVIGFFVNAPLTVIAYVVATWVIPRDNWRLPGDEAEGLAEGPEDIAGEDAPYAAARAAAHAEAAERWNERAEQMRERAGEAGGRQAGRRERRRAEREGRRMAGEGAATDKGPAAGTDLPPELAFATLRAKFRDLEERAGRMEESVTSGEAELRREFGRMQTPDAGEDGKAAS
jgi:phage shock protein PspC (stress-responsive transcriptional regulator)